MNAEQYRAVIGWFNARPAAKKALRLVSRSDVLAGLAFGSVFAVLGWNAFVLAASALGFYAIMLL